MFIRAICTDSEHWSAKCKRMQSPDASKRWITSLILFRRTTEILLDIVRETMVPPSPLFPPSNLDLERYDHVGFQSVARLFDAILLCCASTSAEEAPSASPPEY